MLFIKYCVITLFQFIVKQLCYYTRVNMLLLWKTGTREWALHHIVKQGYTKNLLLMTLVSSLSNFLTCLGNHASSWVGRVPN